MRQFRSMWKFRDTCSAEKVALFGPEYPLKKSHIEVFVTNGRKRKSRNRSRGRYLFSFAFLMVVIHYS